MANFVLIHGAMHGGWCWELVVPQLIQHGHHVVAPDLPGLGSSKLPAAEVTLESWGKFVADILHKIPGRTILAGHSLGGIAISQAAEYAPAQVAALVYVTAVLLPNGLASRDLPQEKSRVEVSLSADGQTISASPQAAVAAFYGETPVAWRDAALARLVPQPVAISGMKLQLSEARYGAVKRAYIECLRDQALTIDVQRKMQAALPCDFTAAIDTDHSPFYSQPEALTKLLMEIAARFD
jgi:pimeloyl-ACP methyl ester carboxylesterase